MTKFVCVMCKTEIESGDWDHSVATCSNCGHHQRYPDRVDVLELKPRQEKVKSEGVK